jgi:hypothetical protein
MQDSGLCVVCGAFLLPIQADRSLSGLQDASACATAYDRHRSVEGCDLSHGGPWFATDAPSTKTVSEHQICIMTYGKIMNIHSQDDCT